MYGGGGDCQVLSTLGGNVVNCSNESLFSSSPMPNPNLSFINNMSSYNPFAEITPKQEMMQQQHQGMGGGGGGGGGSREEEMESGSGSGHLEGGSADDLENEEQPKRKRYHRHTAHQIAEMEALFKECPHPDDKQRMKLSQELGLKPRQVKFWFQNRRTQMKAHQDRSDNAILRAENESLKNENFRLQSALRNLSCPNCGGPAIMGEMSIDEQHLRIENARLKDEVERLSSITGRFTGRPMHALQQPPPGLLMPSLDLDMNVYSRHFQEPMGTCSEMMPISALPDNSHMLGGILIMEQEKQLAIELAMSAMDELVKMCQVAEPLWIQSDNENKEVLNMEEYAKMFPWAMNKQHHSQLRTEATRDSTVVIMNSITLVDAFLDVNKWMEMFPSIVSRAKTLQIITSGISGHSGGSLYLMYAEFQALSPLIPMRETHFIRYFHQNVEEGTWVIVDFPIDSLRDNQNSFPRYCRRPSGCIIRDMPNGYSRVTWVEHAEVEDKQIHQVFNHFVLSGIAFGAQRWLSVLAQQCERVASLMARNISDLGVIPTPEARRNMMKLAHRMIKLFCFNMSTSETPSWTTLSGSSEDTIRITTRKIIEPGQPNGVVLCAVSTTWLPFAPNHVFEFLRDERRRSQIDVVSSGTSSHEVAHIANGSHPGNCISLFRINASSNSSQNVDLMLQESSTDEAGGLIVYSNIDVDAVQLTMSGEDPSYIPLLPSGFVITPIDYPKTTSDDGSGANGPTSSCLLTVGLQVLASSIPTAKINLSSVSAINGHIVNLVNQINVALQSNISTSFGSGDGRASNETVVTPSEI